MSQETAKRSLLFFSLLVIAFPLLQHRFSFFESGKLNGAVTDAPNPSFSWNNWFEGTYQKQKADYLNDSMGCRPGLVRLNNQLDFWLFRKRHANGVVIGKDECFFEQAYVNEYYGADFVGYANMFSAVERLRKIQDTLEKMGKTFVFIHAPSKAYYFADKLPSRPHGLKENAPTNYYLFKRLADSAGINQIDCNSWFLSLKEKTADRIMTHHGIHWSVYGSLLVADSFIRYIEHRRNIRMPRIHWDKIVHTTTPRNTDDDLVSGLNLIYPLAPENFSYPEYTFEGDSTCTKPRILYIGDSFLWVWFYDYLMNNISKEFDIWYYFRDAWNQNTSHTESSKDVSEINWHEVIQKTDCVTILYVASSYHSFPDTGSVVDKLYKYFYGRK